MSQTLYCLCRSNDCSTFMIACDACNIWYHGTCIGISEKESSRIENFFCHQCRHQNPSLQIKYNRPQKEIEDKLSKYIVRRLRKEAQLLNPNHNDGKQTNTMDVYTNEDSTSNQSDSSSSSANLFNRQTNSFRIPMDSTESTGTNKRTLMTKNAGMGEKRKRNISGNVLPMIKREPQTDLNDEEDTKTLSSRRRRRTTEPPARQCYGPGCLFEARSTSKYCSDKCGLELARNRLLQFLPIRLMQWQMIPSVLDVENKNSIEEIRIEIEQIKQRLTTLVERQRKLDEIIERGKQLKANTDTEKSEVNTDEPDGMCFCVLCNQEVNQKSYIRHIDKCFVRFESQVSYGSNIKSTIEGLFCDNYDRASNLYCKRLKVICPEHSRDPKVGVDEACGCPLEKSLFDVSDELCTVSKRTCSKHFKWDRKRRAQIDLERLHELMRLEELTEKENRLRTALNERGSVMGVLLNKTTAH